MPSPACGASNPDFTKADLFPFGNPSFFIGQGQSDFSIVGDIRYSSVGHASSISSGRGVSVLELLISSRRSCMSES